MNNLCAVTGSSGYLGSVLTTYLESSGISILRMGRNEPIPFDLNTGVTPEFFSSRGVKTLVHCAYDFSPRSWAEIESVNVEGSRKLIEAANLGGVKNIIFISSMSAYVGCRSFYGKAKLRIEEITQERSGKIVRPGLIYGAAPGGMVGTLIRILKFSPIIPMIGMGDQILYTIHEEDLSKLVLDLIKKPEVILTKPIIAAHPDGLIFRRILSHFSCRFLKEFYLIPIP